MKKIIILLALFSAAVFAQQKSTFTDPRDKKSYKTVKIGKQTWMAENLDYHGEDGYLGLCHGDKPKKKIRKPENCKKYGRLYDWNEAMKACPSGWHLPSDEEWDELMDFAGGKDVAGKKLKSKTGWKKHDFMSATDEFGFSALPGGNGISGSESYRVNIGNWWSSSENGRINSLNAYLKDVAYNVDIAYYSYNDRSLFSVRCVQD